MSKVLDSAVMPRLPAFPASSDKTLEADQPNKAEGALTKSKSSVSTNGTRDPKFAGYVDAKITIGDPRTRQERTEAAKARGNAFTSSKRRAEPMRVIRRIEADVDGDGKTDLIPVHGRGPTRDVFVDLDNDGAEDNFPIARQDDASLPVGGSLFEQASAAAFAVYSTPLAVMSAKTKGRFPPDGIVRAMLKNRAEQTLIPGAPKLVTTHTSRIEGASAQEVANKFIEDLPNIFGAAGVRFRTGGRPIEDGVRIMLEEPSLKAFLPTVWAPIEVVIPEPEGTLGGSDLPPVLQMAASQSRLQDQSFKVRINCLHGHPLRGYNEFEFKPGPDGSVEVSQTTVTQGSSRAIDTVGKLIGADERQDEIWAVVHAYIADKFGSGGGQ